MRKIIFSFLMIVLMITSTVSSQTGWFQQESGTEETLYDVFFINSQTGWIAGEFAKILKTTNGGLNWITQISNSGRFFSFAKLYPFNPRTGINYYIPSNVKREKSNVKLIIHDVTGKEKAVLVNADQSPGSYSVEWDGSNFPSGVYFYELSGGGFTNVKKMILIR